MRDRIVHATSHAASTPNATLNQHKEKDEYSVPYNIRINLGEGRADTGSVSVSVT